MGLLLFLSGVSLRVSGAVSMGEAAKPFVWTNVKVSKFEEVSSEMLVLMFPRVSCRVFGFPLAPQCLWRKLQKQSFPKCHKKSRLSSGPAESMGETAETYLFQVHKKLWCRFAGHMWHFVTCGCATVMAEICCAYGKKYRTGPHGGVIFQWKCA